MADDEDSNLLNMLLDDETSWSPTILAPEVRHPKRRTRKHSRPMLQCVVCGDHAEGRKIFIKMILLIANTNDRILGYNFDAISCESCKAFFRRNALRPAVRRVKNERMLPLTSDEKKNIG